MMIIETELETALYRGLRVLCSGDPVAQSGTYFGYSGSASTVKDDNGRLIKNSVLEYTGTKWLVKYRPYEDQFASNYQHQLNSK